MSKSACFFEKANISGLFFSPDCRKFKDFFNFFSAIYKVNPAIPLCRTGVGWTPGSNGRIAVSQDKNEHFFEKTGKNSAPSDISEKPKNRQKMLITGIKKSVCHTLGGWTVSSASSFYCILLDMFFAKK